MTDANERLTQFLDDARNLGMKTTNIPSSFYLAFPAGLPECSEYSNAGQETAAHSDGDHHLKILETFE